MFFVHTKLGVGHWTIYLRFFGTALAEASLNCLLALDGLRHTTSYEKLSSVPFSLCYFTVLRHISDKQLL